ncbi:MAG: hypothetical protein Kow0019_10170 [Methanobacteriaceae archaeon]
MWKAIILMGILDAFREKHGSLKYYKKRLEEYREHEADTLIDMGVIYLEDEKIPEALEKFKDALKLYQKLQFTEGEAYTQNLIGDTYLTSRNLEESLKHYQESFKLYTSIRSPLKNELLEKIKDTEKAKKAMEIADKS